MKPRITIFAALALTLLGACGTINIAEYANSLIGADGQPIFLDDIRAITSDGALSDEQQRTQLRDLGLEDEKLIDALVVG